MRLYLAMVSAMPTTDLFIPARYFVRLKDLLEADGINTEALLKPLKLSSAGLGEPDALIRFSLVDQLLQQVVAMCERTDLAFEVGKHLTANTHSFVGFGMLSSATIDEALRFEARYFGLVLPAFEMRYISSAEFADMYFTPRVAMSRTCLDFHLEGIAIAVWREISDLTGEHMPPVVLECGYQEPPHIHRYRRELHNLRVSFDCELPPGVKLRIGRDPRAIPLSMADENALQIAEARCRALIQRSVRAGRLADWIAMTLREVPGELPSLDELAASVNLSRRTLNRYLASEGTSFRAIAGRVQHELACERLVQKGMSVKEVAYSLGFDNPSNFLRAFKQRAGCTAGEYQRGSDVAPH